MTSLRNYLTVAEYRAYSDVGSTEADAEILKKISRAEELIDAYVGYQDKFLSRDYRGEVSAATAGKIFDIDPRTNLDVYDSFYVGCTIEILAGAGAGQSRRITASSKAEKSISYEGSDLGANTTSLFRIYQLGKFPRRKDTHTNRAGTLWLRSIPDQVKQATAAQVEYMIEMGDDYFSTDSSDAGSESIGNYSYSQGSSGYRTALTKMVGPKARALLKGIKNSTGRILRDET